MSDIWLQEKIMTTTDFNPSKEAIIFEELAAKIDAANSLFSTFRQNFRPNPMQAKIIKDFVSGPDGLHEILIFGGTGSGKSALAYALCCLQLQNAGATVLGIRRVYTQIEDSMIPAINKMFQIYNIKYGYKGKPAPTYVLPNESKLILRSEAKSGGAAESTAANLGSLELSGAYINEGNEISEGYYNMLITRMRQRKLTGKMLIVIDCNPPPQSHWIYRKFFIDNDGTDHTGLIRAYQLPINDNLAHVGEDYLNDLKEKFKAQPALYKRYVLGEFTPNVQGLPVYKGIFNYSAHVSTTPLKWNPKYPLLRGWDFGFVHPACVIAQEDFDTGHLNILRVSMGERVFLEDYAKSILNMCDRLYPDALWKDFCDPAGVAMSDVSKKTSIDVLKSLGIRPKFKRNTIDFGLGVIKQLMTEITSVTGRPILQICPRNCGLLSDAFDMGYTYLSDKKARDNKKLYVHKDGYYEHVMDALRYMITGVRGLGKTEGRKQDKGYIEYNKEYSDSFARDWFPDDFYIIHSDIRSFR